MSYNSCTAFVVIVMTMLNFHCHFFHRLMYLVSEALESYRRLFTYSYFPLRLISSVGTTWLLQNSKRTVEGRGDMLYCMGFESSLLIVT